jgi:sialate O-acetylesterase
LYRLLQKTQIKSWRRAWRDDAMPFLITQLAAFAQHRPENRLPDDFWKDEKPGANPGYAPFRSIQETFLDYPRAGVPCTIDVGDHSDIHPGDKKSVGLRLAHEAMRVAYGDVSCLPGPRARVARCAEGGVEVVFDNVGEGLAIPEGALGPHIVAVAGVDGSFVWADAEVRGRDTLFIRDPGVPGGAARVQYAYNAFAPGPFLRRKGDGLPAFPFRTDVAR